MLTRIGGLAPLCASAILGVAVQFAAGLDGPTFIDVARSAGLTHKIVFGGSERNTYILETTGTGVAFFDYDADGALDLLFSTAPQSVTRRRHPACVCIVGMGAVCLPT